MVKYRSLVSVAALALMLAACNGDEEVKESSASKETTEAVEEKKQEETAEAAVQTVSYLGAEYEVPTKVETIIAASLEAMEDAAVLGVKPAGVISDDGTAIPAYLAKELEGATVVGSKKEPSPEAMLELGADVILGTSKWDEAQIANYNKVAVTFPYSHISINWRDNLTLFGQLTGKEAEAEKVLAEYDATLKEVQDKIAASDMKDQKVLVIRVRGGLAVYPAGVYLNASLYEDFGLTPPAELATIEAQTEITYETLAEWNPDVILIQAENSEETELLNEILENPIFNSTTAAKNERVYVNILEPMAQGGTAWSKVNFLNAFKEQVLK